MAAPSALRSWLSRSRPATTLSLATVRPPRPRIRHSVSPARTLAGSTDGGGDVGRGDAPGEELPFAVRGRRSQRQPLQAQGRRELVRERRQQVGEVQAVLGDGGQRCRRGAGLLQPHELLLAPAGRGRRDEPANPRRPRRRRGSQGDQPRPRQESGARRVHRVNVHTWTGPGCSFTAYAGRSDGRGPGRDWIVRSWSGERDAASRGPQRHSASASGRATATRRPVTCSRRSSTVAGGDAVSYVATTTSPSPESSSTGTPESRARVATALETPAVGAVGESDLPRPRDGSGGGVAHRLAHRVADGGDGVGGRSPRLALRLQIRHGHGRPGARRRPPARRSPATAAGPCHRSSDPLLRAHPGEHRRPQRAEVSLREERHADPRRASPQLHPLVVAVDHDAQVAGRRSRAARRAPAR